MQSPPPPPPPSDPSVVPTAEDTTSARLGRYTIVREIARSNDIVYEGFDPQMNRRVAVKELALPASLTDAARKERIARFFREARAAGTMNHPGIVTIHEVGEDDGRYFIAMEYLDGPTLRQRLARGPIGATDALQIAVRLCDALAYAHSRGVIHRDIKPDNIHLLPDGQIKLTDFGIARITYEDALTAEGQIFGTPSYMSPEQFIGRKIDTRSDLFSLGVVLYEMLTGLKPFAGDSVVTISYRILHDEMPPLTGYPLAMETALKRALAKDPAHRFANAQQFREALTPILEKLTGNRAAADVPVTAPPPPTDTTLRFVAGRAVIGGDSGEHLKPVGLSGQPTLLDGAAVKTQMVFASDLPTPAGTSVEDEARALILAESRRRAERRRRAGVTALVMLALAIGAGGFWSWPRFIRPLLASRTATAYQHNLSEYRRAGRLMAQQNYGEAAGVYHSVWLGASEADLRRKASLGESRALRRLARRAVNAGKLDIAEQHLRNAAALLPDDGGETQSEYEALLRKRKKAIPKRTGASGGGGKPGLLTGPRADK